jgi:hypothetical protein
LWEAQYFCQQPCVNFCPHFVLGNLVNPKLFKLFQVAKGGDRVVEPFLRQPGDLGLEIWDFRTLAQVACHLSE